jgi:hypothetical protein
MSAKRIVILATWPCLIAAVLAYSIPGRCLAEDERSREYQIKAACIYNFVQFVNWPDDAFSDPRQPIVLGVYGPDDPFQGTLEQIVKDKQVNGRHLEVRHPARIEDLHTAQLVFVPQAESAATTPIRDKLAGAPVLMVGESDDFLTAGGMIRFFLEQNKMRFEVNVEAAEQARLRISAKLLKLARIFKRNPA